GLSMLLQ
nr:Chain E, E3 ubiquitin-protein ligase RNF187 peptide [Homo sapiens]7OW2_F Chain F, E3 ubiquitin-protein ligase RNF187 peptide [Homo sapiens]7OW2_G Chain G, E3 ubiquitin-protein ligase RNF187 peptide [Homo sapiens]7OW2_H Chain H, E3 ubiquitin-protein ligase RNF187 peptide [Homo sapiens]